jgi:uncharacterized damage-inducible protein DinB
MATLLTLLDHMAWADAQALAAIVTLPEASAERAEATRLYAHLAAAAHVWVARLEGRTPEHPVWPALSLDAARELAARSIAGLREAARRGADGLATEVAYRTTAGQPFRSTVDDVLTHVVLHGVHHRGQIALLTRRGGGTPATTDYIVFARGGAR